MNYDGRCFRVLSNSENGETGTETVFRYRQNGAILSGDYSGGVIREGDLLGTVLENRELDFVYHHINQAGEVMASHCHSIPTRPRCLWTAGAAGKLAVVHRRQIDGTF
ncbi:hypothetical protein ACT6QG_04690 [Xanthobacter sp. TB0136]|uniref:hypothetical protein n=1 Tax=Xanthobacter sp. TB0136 TaxID=3459177 RepID=UPI00403A5B1E